MAIKPLRKYTAQAFAKIAKIQKGEKLLPKTGYDFIDNHITCLLPGDVILISSPSGTGKTTISQGIKKNVLNTEINPEADKYVYVDFSLEMKVFNLLMRGYSEVLKKKKSEVLFNEFTEEEQVKVREYYESLNDDRQFLDQVPPTPEEFYNSAKEFLLKNQDKEAVFFSFDHLLLAKGTDKNKMLNALCEYINLLKLEFDNVYFILISQSNRDIYTRIGEKNNRSAPMPLDVFGSSFMDQLCSYNIFMYNAYRAGIKEYMKVNPDRYEYLSEHFTEEDSKGRVSFHTEGLIFIHCLKVRESDNMYKDIYVIDMGLSEEEKEELREIDKKVVDNDMPVFPSNEDLPVLTPDQAFGPSSSGNDDVPF